MAGTYRETAADYLQNVLEGELPMRGATSVGASPTFPVATERAVDLLFRAEIWNRRTKGLHPLVIERHDRFRRALNMRESGHTLREISEALGVSKQRISQMLRWYVWMLHSQHGWQTQVRGMGKKRTVGCRPPIPHPEPKAVRVKKVCFQCGGSESGRYLPVSYPGHIRDVCGTCYDEIFAGCR
jgi:hypothetical protein